MNIQKTESADARPIPPMPGGGTWRFDTDLWAWVSTYPVPTEAPAADAPATGTQPADVSATEQE